MARSLNKEIRDAIYALHYIERAIAKGQDVSRLAEKHEKAQERLIRHRRCFHCGTELTDRESVKAWEVDRLGPVCRERLGGLSWREACGAGQRVAS